MVESANPCLSDTEVVRFALDADEVEAFLHGRDACGPRAHERVEDRAPWWRDEAAEPAHEGDGLDGGMLVLRAALPARRLGLVSEGREEAGSAPCVPVGLPRGAPESVA